MNLAISAANEFSYSETFIKQQFEELPCRLRITGAPLATSTFPGGPISPFGSFRSAIDTAIECGLRKKKLEGPQGAELSRRFKREKVDVILANFGPSAVNLLPICKPLGIRMVVHFHGQDAHAKKIVANFSESYRTLGEYASSFIVVSEKMRQAVSDFGIPKEKVSLLRYGVDPKCFVARQKAPRSPLFFGVGRFVDKKAPYLTVMAFAKVLEKNSQAKLVLGGDGPLLETAETVAKCLGVRDQVVFPGVLTPEEVAAWMNRATAFVQHSITPTSGPLEGDSEGTPVAVIEAMMSGLPVISSRHAGIGEIVKEGTTGYLVEERDVGGMAEAMLKLAVDRQRSEQMGREARADAEAKYTSSNYIARLQQIIEDCVSKSS